MPNPIRPITARPIWLSLASLAAFAALPGCTKHDQTPGKPATAPATATVTAKPATDQPPSAKPSPAKSVASDQPATPPAKTPADFATLVKHGQASLDQGDASGALVEFKGAINLDPKNYAGYYGCALAYKASGDTSGATFRFALEAFNDLPTQGGDLTKVKTTLKDILAKEGWVEGDAYIGPTADFDLALERGRHLLDQGQAADALLEFRKAIDAGVAEYQGYLFAAIASYRLGDLASAAQDGKNALPLIQPDDTNADAQKAREVIAMILKKNTFAQKRAEGDAAYGDGLMAKAADAYAAAFAADPSASEVGLKAAGLFADRLNRLLDAAVIWQTVIHQAGASAAAAQSEWVRHQQALDQLLASTLSHQDEWRKSPDLTDPLHLAQAFPDNQELQLILAECYADANDETKTVKYLKNASRLGLTFEQFAKQAIFAERIAAEPEGPLAAFVRDAFGSDQLDATLARGRVWHDHLRWTVPGLGLDLMPIPAGTFLMGSPADEPGRGSNEGPQTEVTISQPFWLGRTEVTQGQWQAIMGTDVNQLRRRSPNLDVRTGEGPDFPVYYVTWQDAMDFCAKLTERERKAGRLPPGYTYSLPTEAQWEYACRAGTTTATYAGALRLNDDSHTKELDSIAVYGGDSEVTYASGIDAHQMNPRLPSGHLIGVFPVGQKAPNVWGLYDMLGNVGEWCWDGWHKYAGGSPKDPVGPSSATEKIRRGGTFASEPRWVRAATRGSSALDQRFFNLGFRVALTPVR